MKKENYTFAFTGALTILLLASCFIIFAPFILIWSLNTLFSLVIPFTFKTWVASFIVGVTVAARGTREKLFGDSDRHEVPCD
jgi:hypothetical protein